MDDDQKAEIAKQEKRKERDERKQYAGDLRWILSQPQGRRFMWRMFERCGENRTSFTGNSTTFFNEGMRNIALSLKADITEHAPERYWEMVKENTSPDK